MNDDQLIDDLITILGETTTGPSDNPTRTRRLDLALQRMKDHQATNHPPGHHGERGGTNNPTTLSDYTEDRRVSAAAYRDHPQALELRRQLALIASLLRVIVVRHVATIDHSRLPKETDGIPGCVSCAREATIHKVKMGGHFEAVSDRPMYLVAGLCRTCGDIARADGIDKGLKALGQPPPIEFCDIYHRVGAQAAYRWLAHHHRKRETRRAS